MSSRLPNWRGGEGGPPSIIDYARQQQENLLPYQPPNYKPVNFGSEYDRFQRPSWGGSSNASSRARLNSYPQRRTLIDTFVTRDPAYWQTRVTLKIDVPFTDHSHIIGRQGKNTQKVMKDTQCHIHFPDSNKSQECEKSNQVSIAGPPAMVEEARARIRKLAPLTITFELKNMRQDVDLASLVNHPALETAVATEDLHVLVRHNRSSRQPFALIRGSVHQEELIKQAAMNLMSLVFNPGQQVLCSTALEVLQPQQDAVKGPNSINTFLIAQRTGAAIHYPDVSRAGATTFFLQGTLDAILAARAHIVGCLPVHMMFEMDMDQPGHNVDLPALEAAYHCSLTLRTKKSGDSKTAVVSTLECNLSQAYAFRRVLLSTGNPGGPKPSCLAREPIVHCPDYDFMRGLIQVQPLPPHFPPEIAQSHFLPQLPFPPTHPHFSHQQPFHIPGVVSQTVPSNHVMSNRLAPFFNYPSQQTVGPLTTNFGGAANHSDYSVGHPPTILTNSLANSTGDLLIPSALLESSNGPVINAGACNLNSVGVGTTPGVNSSPAFRAPHPTPVSKDYQRTPRANLDDQLTAAELGGLSDDGTTPLGSAHTSPLKKVDLQKAPGSGRRLRFADRDAAQLEAQKVMQTAPSGVRVPDSYFSGLLFSKTMNENKLRVALNDHTIANFAALGLEQAIQDSESTADETSGGSAQLPTWSPTSSPVRVGKFAETTHFDGGMGRGGFGWKMEDIEEALAMSQYVPDILHRFGLGNHVPLFLEQEVTDLEALLDMTDDDLKTMGLTSFGARRKILGLQRSIKALPRFSYGRL